MNKLLLYKKQKKPEITKYNTNENYNNISLESINNYSVVIARNKNDIEWAKDYNTFIYNSGDYLPNTILMPKNTNPSYIYLYHIINMYDYLTEYIIFTPDDPFIYSPNFTKKINYILNNKINDDFIILSKYIYKSNIHRCLHKPELPLNEIYNTIFNTNILFKNIIFSNGGLFMVSKNCIYTKPKTYYENLIKYLDGLTQHYCFERLWLYIFINI